MQTMRSFVALLVLLCGGCAGQRLADNPNDERIPPGTAVVINRCFDPALLPFLADIRIGSFDKDDCGFVGYYFPLVGVRIAVEEIGHSEFEVTLVHELLHAVHFNELVDKSAFSAACARMLADPTQTALIAQIHTLPWTNFTDGVFQQSEYFARIGEAIIAGRGIGFPAYLLDAYKGILHPNVWLNAATYERQPILPIAQVECDDGSHLINADLVAHALGITSKKARCLPRQDIHLLTVRCDIPFDINLDRPTMVVWRRRSTMQVLGSGQGWPMTINNRRLLECLWDKPHARAIMAAYLDMDLSIEVFDGVLALQHR